MLKLYDRHYSTNGANKTLVATARNSLSCQRSLALAVATA
jgi:hypothetical protein